MTGQSAEHSWQRKGWSMQMTSGELTGSHLIFRPEAFFLRPWSGGGVSRGPTGRIIARFIASGRGRIDEADRSALLEQSVRYDDGRESALTWRIVSDDEGHFVATEQGSGIQAEGGAEGPDFRWAFTAPSPTPLGLLKVRCEVTYSMVEPDAAISYARLTRWGIPLGSLTTYYRHR
jgi:hypothetical protein